VTRTRFTLRTASAEQTRRLGQALGAAAQAGDLFLLEGPFGVGKTVLVQGLAAGLGIAEPVTSPSFVLMVEHAIPGQRRRLVHVDLYRLNGEIDDEMLDALADAAESDAVCAVEWPDAVPAALRQAATTITLTSLDDETREIRIDSPVERLVAAARLAGAD